MAPIVCPNCCSTSEVKLKPYLIISGLFIAIIGFIDVIMNIVIDFFSLIDVKIFFFNVDGH